METCSNEEQLVALEELKERGLAMTTAFRVKELLLWVCNADTRQATRWQATRFFEFAQEFAGESALLEPIRKSLNTFRNFLLESYGGGTPCS